jgi:hypothetical protein
MSNPQKKTSLIIINYKIVKKRYYKKNYKRMQINNFLLLLLLSKVKNLMNPHMKLKIGLRKMTNNLFYNLKNEIK